MCTWNPIEYTIRLRTKRGSQVRTREKHLCQLDYLQLICQNMSDYFEKERLCGSGWTLCKFLYRTVLKCCVEGSWVFCLNCVKWF